MEAMNRVPKEVLNDIGRRGGRGHTIEPVFLDFIEWAAKVSNWNTRKRFVSDDNWRKWQKQRSNGSIKVRAGAIARACLVTQVPPEEMPGVSREAVAGIWDLLDGENVRQYFAPEQNSEIQVNEFWESRGASGAPKTLTGIATSSELAAELISVRDSVQLVDFKSLSLCVRQATIVTDVSERITWTVNRMNSARREILLLGYGLTWLDRVDESTKKFFQKPLRFHILLLDPDSEGLREKARLEAADEFASDMPPSEINRRIESEIEAHRSRVNESVTWLKNKWRPRASGGAELQCRLYSDTPFLNGTLIDDESLTISSYFFGPTARGLTLPSLMYDDVEKSPEAMVLKSLFRNWFSVKWASGRPVIE